MYKDKESVLQQYRNSSHLDARIRIHNLYSTNNEDFHHWLFDQVDFTEADRVAEFGCGSGAFWTKNQEKLEKTFDLVLTDLSEGMLGDAKHNVSDFLIARFDVMDVQAPQFADESIDLVICNHMLYHVPDVNKALKEIHRILKPDGLLITSTNGKRHMAELGDWLDEYDSSLDWLSNDFLDNFCLETGKDKLLKHFNNVELRRFESNLEVPDIEDLMDYYHSTGSIDLENQESRKAFAAYLETKRDQGIFKVTKDSGVFISRK